MSSFLTSKRLLAFVALWNESGGTFFETALLLPLIIIPLIIGGVEFGRVAYFSDQVNKAAAAAVSVGAQSPFTASQTANIQAAAFLQAPDLLRISTSTPALEVITTTACACSNGTAITCEDKSHCVSPASTYTTLQVQTRATIPSFFHFPGLPKTYNLTGKASSYIGIQ